jgi:glycosyltransferase involved in cell wall biosynthesis
VTCRPRVSVCVAAYNGERFIADQLRSILGQLSPRDEIIIVDDASCDRTRQIIRAERDDRIRLIEHQVNHGVLVSFEEAVRGAAGEIIFLSDQDDIWLPGKVSEVLAAFDRYPESAVVVSDAALIDQDGNTVAPSYFRDRPFKAGLLPNLLHCRYLGCVMAFRSALVPGILPFPRGFDVGHDIWIGTRNAISGGATCYIDKPLVLYRRHAENLTGRRRLPRFRQIRLRAHLLWALARRSLLANSQAKALQKSTAVP